MVWIWIKSQIIELMALFLILIHQFYRYNIHWFKGGSYSQGTETNNYNFTRQIIVIKLAKHNFLPYTRGGDRLLKNMLAIPEVAPRRSKLRFKKVAIAII